MLIFYIFEKSKQELNFNKIMKKIILGFFMLLFPFLSYAQLPTNEGFENATFPPTAPGNWITMDNGTGTGVSWAETNDITRVNSGLKAAIMDREAIGAGNTSIDWLVTPQLTVGANSQLRFFTRQTLLGNNGATYEIRVSTNASQTNQAAYTTVQTWNETSLNLVYNVYEEKTVSLAAYPAGTQLYIAFVRLNTQPSTATTGDRWLIDDVKVVQQCLDPTVLNVGTITPTTAVLTWTANGTPLNYELEVIPAVNTFTNVATQTGATNNAVYSSLTPGTAYKYQVRANCGGGNFSAWVGPFNFLTTPAGSICASPLAITSLPFSQTSNTNLYGDDVDIIQGTGLCGAVPATTNYQEGAEVFYSYTPTVSGNITITMNPTGASSSLFVYNGCTNYPGTCIAGVANTNATPRTIASLAVVAGQTYIIAISSSTTPVAGIPYTLIVQDFNCAAPVGRPTTGITTTGANLSWTGPTAATTAWEVAIQPAGSGIPTGAGLPATTNTNWATPTLTIATAYQYWVRSSCGGGLFSAWAGPYLFNTETCLASEKCNYIFRLTDTSGGWDGARMEVKQNGIVVATLGSTFTSGTSLNVAVPLCQTLPFDLFWTVSGSAPTQVGITIFNNAPFSQIIYTKPAGIGNPSTTVPLYTTTFNCSQPACLPPTGLTTTAITTAGATLGWATSAGVNTWDVYVVPTGSPAPTSASVPTFNDVTTNPLVINTLLPDTTYQYYVRAVCNATTNSNWTVVSEFTTLPTCSRPTSPTVTGVTQSSATFNWIQPVNPPPGGGTATEWEIFVLPCSAPAPTAASIPTVTVNTNPYTRTGLTPLTCYNFYVRAKCSTTDISPATAVVIFNTPDVNDECVNAKLIPVNQNTNCLQTTLGSVAGATSSPEGNVGVGCSTTADDDDVWFKFVATDTKHYISLLGVDYAINPFGLSFAFYTGSCGTLTQIGACVTALTTSHVRTGLTPGQTYYVRVYSTATTASIQQFEICVGTNVILCPAALPLCAITPIILPANTGVPPSPNPVSPFSTASTAVGCLFDAPAPTFYYLQIPTSGNYVFSLELNTNITFTGTLLDVDFVAWGPYASSTAACANISTTNAPPTGNFCSYASTFTAPTETLTINGAVAGQVYVVMLTNFSQRKGFIRITQTSGPIPANCCPYTNFSYASAAFCKGGVNPVPSTQFGGTFGTFSSTAGLVIDPVTGLIDLAVSAVGTYTVKNTIQANGSCTFQESTWSVTISNPPTATISYPAPSAFCKDTITPQLVTQTGSTGGTYNSTPAGLTINFTTGAIIPSTSTIGTYSVKYSVNNVLGCPTYEALTTVTISPVPIATIVSSDADNTICSNETATLTVTPTNFAVNDATYSWTLNGNAIANTTNVLSPTATGTYQAIVNLNGCTTATPVTTTFTVNALPDFTVTSTNLVKCVNETAVLTVTPVNFVTTDPVTYSWTLDGVAVSPTNNTSTFSTTSYGTYAVTVNNAGCTTTKSVTISLDTANIPINTVGECVGANYIITAKPTNGSYVDTSAGVSYEWKNDSGSNVGLNQSTFNVTQYLANGGNPSFPQTFTVKITTKPDGCTDDQSYVVDNPICTIQRGLSPNNDGKNDFFDLRGLGVKELSIFNRLGSKIYSKENYTNEWRGQNSKSENSPVGTYYYVIELKTGESKTGWIYINR